ncbi:hypothetical protein FACS18942_05020 [Planctomycetales bacterium]|nr:hypothetical protein FACS18942_05020 [Planctomycetales bacterium]GHT37039.1 hypothetical protein FACS189427_09510 [Planctomycetales bacterium]
MSISEIVLQVIRGLNLVPSQNVRIKEIADTDFDGITKILISEGAAVPEDVHQFGVLSQRTTLDVFLLSANRQQADSVLASVILALQNGFRRRERQYNTGNTAAGIMSAELSGKTIINIPNRQEFQGSVSFSILHNFGL